MIPLVDTSPPALQPVPPSRVARRAFTIPEMLAVVAIIVIILAMLLPALQSGREPVYAAVCESNLHQTMVSCYNYAIDNRGYLPFPNWGAYGRDNDWDSGGWLYYNEAQESWSSNDDWTPEILETGVIFQYHNDKSLYRCPKDKPPWPILSGQVTSYNMNGSVCGYRGGRVFRKSQFKGSDFLFWEVDTYVTTEGWWWDGANYPGEGIGTNWHALGGTLVALDGHCEWMQYDEFLTERTKPQKNRLYNNPQTSNGRQSSD